MKVLGLWRGIELRTFWIGSNWSRDRSSYTSLLEQLSQGYYSLRSFSRWPDTKEIYGAWKKFGRFKPCTSQSWANSFNHLGTSAMAVPSIQIMCCGDFKINTEGWSLSKLNRVLNALWRRVAIFRTKHFRTKFFVPPSASVSLSSLFKLENLFHDFSFPNEIVTIIYLFTVYYTLRLLLIIICCYISWL